MTKMSQCSFVVLLTLYLASCLAMFSQDMRPMAASLAPHITASGRKIVGVVDFTDLEGNPTKLGRFLAEEFSIALLQDAKGFEVVDRTHLKALLQENQLASDGLIDPATARKLGQIAGVDALVTGTITPFEEHIRLSLKVLDPETAKMLAADTADIPKTKTLADILSAELSGGSQQSRSSGSSSAAGSRESRPAPSAQPAAVSQNEFTYTPRGCTAKGSSVTCVLSVTNTEDTNRTIWFETRGSSLIDDLGNQYPVDYNRLTFGASSNRQTLLPDVPINLSFTVENVSLASSRLTLMLIYRYPRGPNFEEATLSIRNVLISRH